MAPRAGAAPKRKNGVATDKNHAVKQKATALALQGAEHLPQPARDIFASCLPHCFPIEHPYQQRLLRSVADSLRGVEESLSRRVAEVGAEALAATTRVTALAHAQEVASEGLAASNNALVAEKACMSSVNGEIFKAQEMVKNCAKNLRLCDEEIATYAMEIYQLEEIGANPASLAPDSAILVQKQSFRHAVAARVRLCASAQDAQRVYASAEAKLAAQKTSLETAESARYAAALHLKECWERVRQIPMEQQRLDAALADSKAKLCEFRAGPLKFVTSAIEASAELVHQVHQVIPKTTTFNRRASFADIRKRRNSFIPRKRVSLNAAETEAVGAVVSCDAAQKAAGKSSDVTMVLSVPTPARRSS